MTRKSLVRTAQEIAQHAAHPPRQPGEQGLRVNALSPHFERLVIESLRGFIIKQTQEVEKLIAQELTHLRALLPEESQPQLDLSAARINELLHSVYKD